MADVDPAHSALEGGQGQPADEALTRAELILKGALAAGAAYGLVAMAPFAQRALAATGGGDVEILNFLLHFEYLQRTLYERGKSEIGDKGERMVLNSEQKGLVAALLEEERQHVAAVQKEVEKLGGKPTPAGDYAFAFRFPETFFGLASTIEKSAVAIYNYLLPEMESRSLRELAASIVQVEGRHLAAVRTQVPVEPVPDAFDTAYPRLIAINSIEKYTGPRIYEELG